MQVEETLTVGTGSPDDAAARGADLKLCGELRLTRWAGTTFRQLGKPGLFLYLLLVLLRPRPARTQQEIEEEAAEKAERHQEREEALEPAIGGACTTIMPHPDNQADPETEHEHQGTSSKPG